MNKDNLIKYIQTVLSMSNEKANHLSEKFKLKEVLKNDLVLKDGKVSRQNYFLEAGYIRSFTFDTDGNDVTTNIFSAPCFVNDFLSFFKQRPTDENFESLTDCRLWYMSFEEVQESFHSIPEFREFGRLLLVNNYSLLKQRMLGMIKDTAETRYTNFIETHPDIFQNVSLKIIASYLGITDTSLSRIRREIVKK